MRLKAEQLTQHLNQGLRPIYLVGGEEPLLIQEATDQIRLSARQQEFTERECLHVEQGFDWQTLTAETSNLSLFSDKKIIELRLPTGKPGDQGAKALVSYAKAPPPDTLLLVICNKLDKSILKSKWASTLESAGAVIQIWPVSPQQLPKWVASRLKQKGLQADPEAIALLCERTEGNLLAAQQEIEKLSLTAVDSTLNASALSQHVGNNARYNLFAMIDEALKGNARQASKMLQGLQEEGSEALVILWALNKDIHTLLKVSELAKQGKPLDAAIQASGVWQSRRALISQAAKRLNHTQISTLISLAGEADRSAKGMSEANIWSQLNLLLLALSGTSPLSRQTVALMTTKI